MDFTKTALNKLLDKIAPWQLAEEWDNVGMLVESPIKVVKSILVALEPSWDVLKEAVDRKADCLITHHPLFFDLPRKFSEANLSARKTTFIIKNEINYYSFHTNFDSALGGANDILANLLHLESARPVKPRLLPEEKKRNLDILEARNGLGRVGNLPSTSLKNLSSYLSNMLTVSNIRISGHMCEINRAAVCSGSGGDMWQASIEMGADVLITGDVKYHQAQEAKERGLPIIDVGHFSSERFAMKSFSKILINRLADIPEGKRVNVFFSEKEADPFL